MALDEIQSYLGRACSVVVRCRACGREHARRGVLTPGARRGDVMLSGVCYCVDDFISISADPVEGSFSLPLGRLLPYLGIAAGFASWLHLLRR